MSTTKSEFLRERVRTILAQRTGYSPTASSVAEATLDTWQQVVAQLASVIGVRGVDALFSHSLHVTSKDFPWLAIDGNHGNSAALLVSLKACLADRESAAAAEASYALLVNFTELLASLIGESLTEHLLAPVWVLPLPEPEQESAA